MEADSWVIPPWRPDGAPPPPRPRSWARQAACAVEEGNWFPSNPGDVSAERVVCWTCPVRLGCLDYALDAGESFGIWGGLTPKERRALVRRLKAGTGAVTRRVA